MHILTRYVVTVVLSIMLLVSITFAEAVMTPEPTTISFGIIVQN